MRKILTLVISFYSVWLQSQITLSSISISPSITVGKSLASYSFSGSGTDTIGVFVTDNNYNVLLTLRSNFVCSSGSYQDSIILDNYPDGFFYFTLTHGQQIFASKQIIKSALANVNDLTKADLFKIHPNPFTGILKFEFEDFEASHFNIEIINSLGQQICAISAGDSEQEIDLSSFPIGIYYAKITNGSVIEIFKIIKQ